MLVPSGQIIRRRRGEAHLGVQGVRAAEPQGVHPPAEAEGVAAAGRPEQRWAMPAAPRPSRRPRHRLPHPGAQSRPLQAAAGVPEVVPPARRQLLLRPPASARAR